MKNYMNQAKLVGSFLTLAASASLSFGAQNASDNAGNYSGWGMGNSSGSQASAGTGFGSWNFINTEPNGGFSGEFVGAGYNNGGTINSGNGNAFGFYANSAASDESQAIAPFIGNLSAGQTFSVQGMVDNIGDQGGEIGLDLQDNTSANIFSTYFVGGLNDWFINVGGNQVDTGLGFTKSPLTFSFTQGAGNTWSFTISALGGSSETLTSASTGDLLTSSTISQVDLFNQNGADNGNQNDNSYFNNLVIVPEPSSLVILGMSGLSAMFMFRRRK